MELPMDEFAGPRINNPENIPIDENAYKLLNNSLKDLDNTPAQDSEVTILPVKGPKSTYAKWRHNQDIPDSLGGVDWRNIMGPIRDPSDHARTLMRRRRQHEKQQLK